MKNKSGTKVFSISSIRQNFATIFSIMVSANTVTDANICTKVSTIKKMDKKPEARVSNPTAPETPLLKDKSPLIQIDASPNTGPVSRC